MPLAAKKNQRTEKVTPAQLDVEPVPAPEEEAPPAPPKVTALVYSYNNEAGLRRCLAALEASTVRAAMEILVVDKGSQDGSPALDTEFPEATFLRLPRNFGNTKALNIGMRTGTAENVLFLPPEIEVEPDTVGRLLQQLESDSEAVAVCPLVTSAGGGPVPQFFQLPTPQSGTHLVPIPVSGEEPVAVEYATFEAMLARKYFIRGINYLDERFGEFGGDAELSFQIQRAGRKTLAMPGIRVTRQARAIRQSEGAETLLEADKVHGLAVYFGKHYGFVSGLTFRIKEVFSALFRFRFSLLLSLLTDTKVDGFQSAQLS